ncbi:efflux RND transporter permease subunit [Kineosporia babensis]|uniref:Efflux RND transporter permease subunit n=1 Tax=Kineosporia babensis TaxID=499548 RepID=A0A9X1SSD7_9ACTN|nr:efflux RND transporter permease subunit [Kineosporia babensis]MCD5310479.1 efflux RND transporter permease subunit [Kineosporia babensis]
MSVLTRLSLANRALVLLVSIAITGFGLMAIPSLKQQLLPSLEFPAAFVTATYSGAAPDAVESQLVEPLEGAVRGVPGVTGVVSTASEGFATVQVELDYGTNIDQASNRMQTAITRISSQLPEGADPQVLAGSTDDFLPAVLLSASAGSGGDTTALADKIEQLVIPEIQEIDGVRSAEVTGAPDRQIVVTPDPTEMAKADVDSQAISAALSAAGTAIPAGSVADGSQSLTVQVGGAISTIEQLRKVYVGAVALGDIAEVESVDVPPTSLTRTDGAESLGISVTSTPDGNPVDISHAIQDSVDDWQAALGTDAQLVTVFDQAPFIEQSVESLATEGVLGLVMAVIVILVFLTSIRSTLVTAVSIPLSVLAALIVMWVDGISLNVLSLGGLTIAIGRVVDDSIVVLENIKRHLEYGEEKIHAITTAVREVAGAITASTITTVAVFLPLTLVGGIIGELFQPFGITVSVALLASLLVSLTIVPVLAFWFLKQPTAEELEHAEEIRAAAEEKERKSFLQRMYVPVIHFAVNWRKSVILASVVIFAATLGMASLLKTNFLDQSGQNTINVTQTLPVGSSLQTTDAAAEKVEGVLAEEGDLDSYQVTVGGGMIPGLGGNANSATFSLTVNEDADIEAVTERLEKKVAALSDAGDVVVGGAQAGFGASDIQVQVQAGDQDVLAEASEQVRAAVAEVSELKDVTSDLSEEIPRVEVAVDPEKAAGAGLTEQAVGGLVANAFRGSQAGQLTIDGVQQNVVISSGTEAPATVAEVRKIQIPTAGGPVNLGQLAEVSTVPGPVQVTRIDGARSATVSGTPTNPDNLGAATSAVTSKLKGLELPAGASYTIGGASAEQGEAFGQLGLALLAAIVIVFVVMVATFRSLVQPLVLLVSIPFAATGAILLLLVTGTPLGVAALIGMLMLVGIVVTNAIVLIDLVNQYRREGMPLNQAVVEGGRHRLRPILMTALATIFALLPMAVGLTGHGGFISQPLAVVVIGGLTTATVLTLVLVPSLYVLVEGGKEKRAAKRAAKKSATAGEAESAKEPVNV